MARLELTAGYVRHCMYVRIAGDRKIPAPHDAPPAIIGAEGSCPTIQHTRGVNETIVTLSWRACADDCRKTVVVETCIIGIEADGWSFATILAAMKFLAGLVHRG